MVHGLETLAAINNKLCEEAEVASEIAEPAPLDITQRVALSIAVGNYVRAEGRFDVACKGFNESASALRNALAGRNHRFIAKIDFKNYLVTYNDRGGFDIQEVESL